MLVGPAAFGLSGLDAAQFALGEFDLKGLGGALRVYSMPVLEATDSPQRRDGGATRLP